MTCQPMFYMLLHLLPKKTAGLVRNTKGGEVSHRRAQERGNSLRRFISVSFSRHSPDTLFCTRYQKTTCLTSAIPAGDMQFLAALGCSALGCNRTRCP